jgi:ribosomal protein L40E
MIICSKCGAENRPGIDVCRMCGEVLEQAYTRSAVSNEEEASRFNTVIFPNLRTRQGSMKLAQGLVCPDCQTINQIAWTYCPRCGRKIDSSFLESMLPPDLSPTIIDAPLSDNNHPHLPPKPQPQAGQLRIRAFEEVSPQPASQASADPEDTSPCPQCGHQNTYESLFCSECGAGIPVAKTIVMTAILPPQGNYLRLLVEPGAQGPIYEIKDEISIGRIQGNITFPNDGYMSNSHARIVRRGKDFILVDEESSNGIFIKMKGETKLSPGDVILIGRQLFRFEG